MSQAGKAQRTRERLVGVALELFATDGFENTSVAQISRAAGVTEMTFYRNFPSKERVVLDDPFDPAIAAAVARQPRDVPALVAVARGIRAVWSSEGTAETDRIRDRLRVIASSPRLRVAMAQSTARTEMAIRDALCARGVDSLDADVAAASAIGALNATLMSWAQRTDEPIGAAIGRALGILEGAR
ncbi:TetR/AcrR family transcriptional regulator [Gordonia sp. DT218]|uniref:TetR/AcrR family transcriptional regulator n=1 Tax=unclassified Gordonia (in: high G+C Gram-positive bacteria) TaxID=2657482 RepID=UPI003CE9E322